MPKRARQAQQLRRKKVALKNRVLILFKTPFEGGSRSAPAFFSLCSKVYKRAIPKVLEIHHVTKTARFSPSAPIAFATLILHIGQRLHAFPLKCPLFLMALSFL